MSLINQEIMELRQLAVKVASGEVGESRAKVLLGIYSQTAKRENMLVQIAVSSEKHGGKDRMWKRLNEMNLIHDKAAIDAPISNTIKCPAQGFCLIDRGQCLDYSGSAAHIDFCQKCEQFSITRNQMTPKDI